mgnify:CR=1
DESATLKKINRLLMFETFFRCERITLSETLHNNYEIKIALKSFTFVPVEPVKNKDPAASNA